MFDRHLRPWIDPPLNAVGGWLASFGISAQTMTLAGFGLGLAAASTIAMGCFALGLVLILLNRVADGLDGPIARASAPTDRGGFLDITLDFAFYAAVPLAFAVYDPPSNALPAAILIATFLINGAAFLAFAIVAQRRGLVSAAQGPKAFYYVAGLAEGAETIVAFCAFCIWQAHFPALAFAFAGLCLVSAVARIIVGWREF